MFIGILFIPFELDNDVWFLLNGGRYVLNYGIPYIEPFTIHEDLSFVMQQWLSGVIYWYIYNKFGGLGLLCLIHIIFFVFVFVIYKLCILVSNKNFQLSVITSTGIGILISIFMRTRPQIFSGLLLLLEIYCLEMYIKERKNKYLFFLPIISLLLINFHASMWPMMIILLIPYLLEFFYFKYKKNIEEIKKLICLKTSIICILAIIIVGFCNPYGIDSMTYLFRSYGYEYINNIIMEMSPLVITSLWGKISIFIMFLLSICYTKQKIKIRYILLAIGTAYMAMSSLRSLFFFYLFGIFPVSYAYRNYFPLKKRSDQQNNKSYKIKFILSLLLVCCLILNVYENYNKINDQIINLSNIGVFFITILVFAFLYCFFKKSNIKIFSIENITNKINQSLIAIIIGIVIILMDANYKSPTVEANLKLVVDYLVENEIDKDIILWTNYNDGAYCEFKELRCYIDARAEVFLEKNNKKKNVFIEYLELEKSKLHYKEFINRYNFTHFLTEKNDLLFTYLYYDSDFKIIYENDKYRLYKKIN